MQLENNEAFLENVLKRGGVCRIFCDHEGLITSSLVIALITHIHHVTTQTHAYMNILLTALYNRLLGMVIEKRATLIHT